MTTRAAVIVVLLCGLAYAGFSLGRESRDAARARQELASAKDTATMLQASSYALSVALRGAQAKAETVWRQRAPVLAKADTQHKSADSAMVVAHIIGADTAALCRPVVVAESLRTSECENNRRALAVDSAAIRVLTTASDSAVGIIDSQARSLASIRAEIAEVRAAGSCTMLHVFGCPSRRNVAILSFLLGTVGGIYLERHRTP